ncbi:MAG: 50S ribosomal protein L28 [Chloroflexaceae bacterium]|nr:50S ribosomal protein L28 [Chloroflexaceae bacterium]
MAKCEFTGKKPSFGSNVSHSKRHTKRMWKPNVSGQDDHWRRR